MPCPGLSYSVLICSRGETLMKSFSFLLCNALSHPFFFRPAVCFPPRFPVTMTDEIRAVSGMASIMPVLAAMPLMVSSPTKGVENSR